MRWIVVLIDANAPSAARNHTEIEFYGGECPKIARDLVAAMRAYGYEVRLETEKRERVE